MMTLRPLQDCVQFILDDKHNEIVLYYYTDVPPRPYDAFTRKKYNLAKERPLYLYEERWEWSYIEEIYKLRLRASEEMGKKEAKALRSKYLDKFLFPTQHGGYTYDYHETVARRILYDTDIFFKRYHWWRLTRKDKNIDHYKLPDEITARDDLMCRLGSSKFMPAPKKITDYEEE